MEYEIKPVGRFSLNLKELWDFRELFYFFTWRDVKVKYKQTVLGFFWAILQPALMMIVFTFFFGKVLGENKNVSLPYPVFVYTGLIFWNIFAGGLQNAGNSMVSNANIIKKIYFPRLIIPMSSILVAVFDFLMTLVLYVALLIYYQVGITWIGVLVYLPLSLIITLLSTFGAGTLLAALNVKYRDFRYVIPFMIQFLMFVTPVIYPINMVEKSWLKFILQLNPMAAAINLARGMFEGQAIDLTMIGYGGLVSLLLLFAGVFYFRKTESYFADLA